jgi:hypothetical protein
MRPTAVQQRLVGDAEDMKEVRQALKDLLAYCRDLGGSCGSGRGWHPARSYRGDHAGPGIAGRAHLTHVPHSGNGLRDAGRRRPGQVPGEAGPDPDLARTFCESPQLHPGIISEMMRVDSYFGLMNYREITEPLVLPDKTVIPGRG